MRNNILWSDEIQIELFHLNAKHGGGSIMLWQCFSAAGTERLVRIKAKMNRAKHSEMFDEKRSAAG